MHSREFTFGKLPTKVQWTVIQEKFTDIGEDYPEISTPQYTPKLQEELTFLKVSRFCKSPSKRNNACAAVIVQNFLSSLRLCSIFLWLLTCSAMLILMLFFFNLWVSSSRKCC